MSVPGESHTSVSVPSTTAPRFARPFVALFLTVLVVSPLTGSNAWPFSNWELFSRLRSDQQTGWAAESVDSSGRERGYEFRTVPRGRHGFEVTMRDFSRRPAAERNAICTGWLHGAVEHLGPATRQLRIYRLTWRLSDRRGDRAAPPRRALAWTCSGKSARAAS
jgi:hypothetical protein